MTYRRALTLIFVLALLAQILVQLLFVGFMEANASKVRTVVQALLSSEIEKADFDKISIFVRNLESDGLISCTHLSLLRSTDSLEVYRSPIASSCHPNWLLLEGVAARLVLRSNDGQDWVFKFVVPHSPMNTMFLWVIRLLIVVTSVVAYYTYKYRVSAVKSANDAIELHLLGIAHDLRSPLGSLKLLNANKSLLRETKGIQLFEKSLLRLEEIIEATLSGSGVGVPGAVSSFKLYKCCKEAIATFQKQFGLEDIRRIEFHLDTSALVNPAVSVVGVFSDFQRILTNIFQNSIEARIGLGPGPVKVGISFRDEGGWICLRIADSGPGFLEHQVKDHKIGAITSSKLAGNGIGLSLAKKAVHSWGGSLEVLSSSYPEPNLKIKLKKKS